MKPPLAVVKWSLIVYTFYGGERCWIHVSKTKPQVHGINEDHLNYGDEIRTY